MKTSANTSSFKKATIGVALAASLALAPVTAASASASAPATVASSSSSSAALAGASIDVRSLNVQLGSVGSATVGNTAEKAGWVKPVIDWIKSNAAGIWNGLVSAVKGGWQAFQNFWNGLADWIKGGITFIAQSGAWEIFQGLWDYFF